MTIIKKKKGEEEEGKGEDGEKLELLYTAGGDEQWRRYDGK